MASQLTTVRCYKQTFYVFLKKQSTSDTFLEIVIQKQVKRQLIIYK